MKQINYIVRKFLLLSMMLFVVHDYVVPQDNLNTLQISSKHISSSNVSTSLSNAEHHVFHSPFLLDENIIGINDISLLSPEFAFEILLSQEYASLPYSPPRFI
jgi:hypothetical protein